MMLLAAASLAVVPVPPWPPGALRAAALADRGQRGLPAATAPAAVLARLWDEAALLELAPLELAAEHPARNMPPPSRTPPIVTPAATPCLVGPVRVRRRVKLRVFSMPL